MLSIDTFKGTHMKHPIKIRWFVAHEPLHLFIRTAEAFKKEVETKTNGQVEVEILTVSDYVEKYSSPEDTDLDAISLAQKGKVEMIQARSMYYGHYDKNFFALDMPYLFTDHAHCTRTLEGSIGTSMRKGLSKRTNLEGLAFTYSGGYRVIGSKDPITSFEELASKVVSVGPNSVDIDTFVALGAIPQIVYSKHEGYDQLRENGDAVNTTYLRFTGNHVTKTNHSMYITCISMNKEFYQSIPEELRVLIDESAIAASRIEREWAIRDAEEFEKSCAEKGITISMLPDDEINKFKEATKPIYAKYRKFWSHPSLTDQIKKQ